MSNASRIQFGVFLAVSLLAGGCATSSGNQPLPTYSEQHTERATATVKAIDQKTRRVRLEAEDGEVFDFVAGPQVKNLAQVKAGDKVVVEYTEAIALEVRRADAAQPELAIAADAAAAAPGDKPAGAIASQVTVSAVIVAIDRETLRVTLKGPGGGLHLLQVRDPKKLEQVRVGDMVHATYTEALGISVEKVP